MRKLVYRPYAKWNPFRYPIFLVSGSWFVAVTLLILLIKFTPSKHEVGVVWFSLCVLLGVGSSLWSAAGVFFLMDMIIGESPVKRYWQLPQQRILTRLSRVSRRHPEVLTYLLDVESKGKTITVLDANELLGYARTQAKLRQRRIQARKLSQLNAQETQRYRDWCHQLHTLNR
ncbi:hypothetical protein ACJU26_08740 [Acidithiobacillus sp. M4-SHS-6]|uniref:hypothetical protein n=1 Tax=Acidithiobacillus sp. M4-SHS-6 TaxID=3383024 RepID=UPI0039BE4476